MEALNSRRKLADRRCLPADRAPTGIRALSGGSGKGPRTWALTTSSPTIMCSAPFTPAGRPRSPAPAPGTTRPCRPDAAQPIQGRHQMAVPGSPESTTRSRCWANRGACWPAPASRPWHGCSPAGGSGSTTLAGTPAAVMSATCSCATTAPRRSACTPITRSTWPPSCAGSRRPTSMHPTDAWPASRGSPRADRTPAVLRRRILATGGRGGQFHRGTRCDHCVQGRSGGQAVVPGTAGRSAWILADGPRVYLPLGRQGRDGHAI